MGRPSVGWRSTVLVASLQAFERARATKHQGEGKDALSLGNMTLVMEQFSPCSMSADI